MSPARPTTDPDTAYEQWRQLRVDNPEIEQQDREQLQRDLAEMKEHGIRDNYSARTRT